MDDRKFCGIKCVLSLPKKRPCQNLYGWLSCGQVLKRFCDLEQNENKLFLEEQKLDEELSEILNPEWKEEDENMRIIA